MLHCFQAVQDLAVFVLGAAGRKADVQGSGNAFKEIVVLIACPGLEQLQLIPEGFRIQGNAAAWDSPP